MPCSFSFVLPRSPKRYGLVQKSSASAYGRGGAFVKRSAAYAPPLNRDDKTIPTPHKRAVFTDLFNTFPGPSSVPGFVYFCLTSEPKAPWAWNVLSPQHVPISAASKKRLPINWRLGITLTSLETGAYHITNGRFTISSNCVGSDTCAGGSRQPWSGLCCCGDAHRQPSGVVLKPNEQDRGNDLTITGVTAKIPNGNFCPFQKLDSKKAPQPAIAQGLSVDRRAGLQDQASRHSHDRTRLGDTTSWTDGVRQDRSDKLDGFGAGEGARTLDPDLGKVRVTDSLGFPGITDAYFLLFDKDILVTLELWSLINLTPVCFPALPRCFPGRREGVWGSERGDYAKAD